MKRMLKLLCVFVLVMNISGCKAGLYMEDFENVQWTCSEMELQYTYYDVETGYATGIICKDDEVIDIICRFSLSKTIDIYDKEKYESRTGEDVCVPLLIGGYSIDGDIATVKILQDNLFNGEYLDKEIHLIKTPIK